MGSSLQNVPTVARSVVGTNRRQNHSNATLLAEFQDDRFRFRTSTTGSGGGLTPPVNAPESVINIDKNRRHRKSDYLNSEILPSSQRSNRSISTVLSHIRRRTRSSPSAASFIVSGTATSSPVGSFSPNSPPRRPGVLCAGEPRPDSRTHRTDRGVERVSHLHETVRSIGDVGLVGLGCGQFDVGPEVTCREFDSLDLRIGSGNRRHAEVTFDEKWL